MKSVVLGEIVDKEVSVNGEMVSKRLEVSSIEEYDNNGNELHYKDNDGYEYWTEYDSNGNEIHSKDADSKEEWYEYEYDDKGNVI